MNGTTQKAPLNIYGSGQLEPPLSHAWVILFVVGLVLVLVRGLLGLLAEWRLLRRAKSTDVGTVGHGGGPTILKGRVVFAQDESFAIRTVIVQEGTERRQKQRWSHHWQESSRQTEVRPFYLQCQGGERVRIEPTERTVLVTETGAPCQTARDRRTITAELHPGRVIFVEGVLRQHADPEQTQTAAGYRQSPLGWVMRHGDPEPLKVSAEPLAKRHRWKLRRIVNNYLLALAWGLAALLLALPYAKCAVTGQERPGQALSTSRHRTKTKNGYRWTYKVHYKTVAGHAQGVLRDSGEVNRSDYERVKEKLSQPLPISPKPSPSGTVPRVYLVVRVYDGVFRPTSQLGRGASIHRLTVIFMLLGGLLVFGFIENGLGARRWYESKLSHDGSGRLPEPPGSSEASVIAESPSAGTAS